MSIFYMWNISDFGRKEYSGARKGLQRGQVKYPIYNLLTTLHMWSAIPY